MVSLDTVAVEHATRVVFIEGGQGVSSHLNTLGIHVGDLLVVVERAPFRGPVMIQVNGTRLALGRGVARRVKVEPIDDTPAQPAPASPASSRIR